MAGRDAELFAYSGPRVIDIKHVRWQLGIATTLLALLGVLATLQYRWLGDVAEAERERIRTALRSRATEFAQDFDSELTKVYVAFHVDGERLDVDAAATIDD
ncbi:MAG TPA: hypothetical protein VNZ26_34435, partial [Vicinamibacterales bacterium]|nr:hypothetical protein [Vicinamibacterales bacterium]